MWKQHRYARYLVASACLWGTTACGAVVGDVFVGTHHANYGITEEDSCSHTLYTGVYNGRVSLSVSSDGQTELRTEQRGYSSMLSWGEGTNTHTPVGGICTWYGTARATADGALRVTFHRAQAESAGGGCQLSGKTASFRCESGSGPYTASTRDVIACRAADGTLPAFIARLARNLAALPLSRTADVQLEVTDSQNHPESRVTIAAGR